MKVIKTKCKNLVMSKLGNTCCIIIEQKEYGFSIPYHIEPNNEEPNNKKKRKKTQCAHKKIENKSERITI